MSNAKKPTPSEGSPIPGMDAGTAALVARNKFLVRASHSTGNCCGGIADSMQEMALNGRRGGGMCLCVNVVIPDCSNFYLLEIRGTDEILLLPAAPRDPGPLWS